MFVRDSKQPGQWISFVCMVESMIPDDEKTMAKHNRLHFVFTAKVWFDNPCPLLVARINFSSIKRSLLVFSAGIQLDHRVLLGIFPSGVEHRPENHSRLDPGDLKGGFGLEARRDMESCGHTCNILNIKQGPPHSHKPTERTRAREMISHREGERKQPSKEVSRG